ncbi:MAG: hypothetical protein HC897_09690 [Thermoanaerobaculia bacterium]|nr:hypothetical protein [Thermoanaerobaculia bacterium]
MAPSRVKTYDPSGQLLAVVAAGDGFEPTAKNMDLAVDPEDRIAVADPARRAVSIFEPVTEEVMA